MARKILFGVFLVLLVSAFYAYAGEVKLTTYYPAPYGEYKKVIVRTLGVGDNIANGVVDSNDAPDPATKSGEVWIAGKLGVKTITPNNSIEVKDLISFKDADWKTLLGYKAGSNDKGQYNTYVGYEAGLGGTITTNAADSNTAIGYRAFYSNSLGYDNTATGKEALYSNDAGYSNTAMGVSALKNNTGGYSNTAIGKNALLSNTDVCNTAIGDSALKSNAGGFSNTATGVDALKSNTEACYNVANGMSALNSNTTGNSNTAIGTEALYDNQSGTDNTAVGYRAGYNATGSNNILIGSGTGGTLTGSGNVLIGSSVYPQSAADANSLSIGNLIFGTNLATGTTISTGRVGIGAIPISDSRVYIKTELTNPSDHQHQLYQDYYTKFTASYQSWNIGHAVNCRPIATTGTTISTGSAIGIFASTLRNDWAGQTDDGGKLSYLTGIATYYGHSNVSSTSPETTTTTGLAVTPILKTGTVFNMIDIWLKTIITGGTATNHYGIYQEDPDAKNYFNGKIGIGTDSPAAKLDVRGTLRASISSGSNTYYVKFNNSTKEFTYSSTSSRRYKNDINSLDFDRDKFMSLEPRSFLWKKDDTADRGFVAEEVEPIFPDMVFYENGQLEGFRYDWLPVYTYSVVKEHHSDIKKIKSAVSINDGNVGIGGSAVIVPRGVKDPSPAVNGMIYYNTDANKFRGCENGEWKDLVL